LLPVFIRKRVLLLAGLAVFAALWSAGAVLGVFSNFNLQISQLLQSANNDVLRTMLYWLAYVNGDWRAAIVVIVVCQPVWGRWGWYDAAFTAAAGLLSELNEGLKAAFHIARPSPELIQVMAAEVGFAYPSGHSCFSMLFYGFLAYLALRNMRSCSKWLVLGACIAMILAIGISRIFLGVHWFSDVIGGYLFGGLLLASLIWVYDTLESKYGKAAVNK
jgi:undecaprenyl-diphosphatase